MRTDIEGSTYGRDEDKCPNNDQNLIGVIYNMQYDHKMLIGGT